MNIAGQNLNVDDDQLSQIIKNWDNKDSSGAGKQQTFYILSESIHNKGNRIVLKDLKSQLPLNDLRRRKPDYQDRQNFYVDVEGDFYPDLVEENGIYLVSEPFLEYLRNTLHLRERIIYNYIGLCSENNERIETYCLLIPPQYDCILPGSARYDKNHQLTYFEIDENKVPRKAEIFRLKGFPHLIITQPVNRFDFAGYECTRIENYFNYAEIRDFDYQERLNGKRLNEAVKEFERRVLASENFHYKYGLTNLTKLAAIQQEVASGLHTIFSSFQGSPFPTVQLNERRLTLIGSWAESKIMLAERTDFTQTEFSLTFLPKTLSFLKTMPEVLKTAGYQLVYETVLTALIHACRIFDNYSKIHGDSRFRIFFSCDYFPTTNPHLIYDYQCPHQRTILTMRDFSKFEWHAKDYREYDFSGKDLNGLKISGANLTNAKFNGCILTNTEFQDCDLTGAEFKQAKLQGAKFINNQMAKANFDYANLQEAEFISCQLPFNSFQKSDLTKVRMLACDLLLSFFDNAKLPNALFTIQDVCAENVFRLCDMRNAKFTKTSNQSDAEIIIDHCDFRNSNLSESIFEVDHIIQANFIKTNLTSADFSKCQSISKSDFRGCLCHAINFEGQILYQNNFSKVDLSRMKMKIGTVFIENNFTYTRFSGCDFTLCGYECANCLIQADFSNCNLEQADFTTSNVILTSFNGANLNNAVFTEEQLSYLQLSPMQRNSIKIMADTEDEIDSEIDDEDEEYLTDMESFEGDDSEKYE